MHNKSYFYLKTLLLHKVYKQIIYIVAITYLISGRTNFFDKTEEEASEKSVIEKQEIKVSFEKANKSVFSKELMSNGLLIAKEKAIVPFQVNEHIEKLQIKKGQQVEEGKLLACINDFTFKKRLMETKNSFNKALIDLEDLLLGYGYALKDTATVTDNVFC